MAGGGGPPRLLGQEGKPRGPGGQCRLHARDGWAATVEWPAWYEGDFDRRIRLKPRYGVIVGYNLNDSLSTSSFGSNQLYRLLDLAQPQEAAEACNAFIQVRTLLRCTARHADRPVLQCTASAGRFGIAEANTWSSGRTSTAWRAKKKCWRGTATRCGRV